jgi:hypothetical protein
MKARSKTAKKKPVTEKPAAKRKTQTKKPKAFEPAISGKSTKPKMSKYGFITSSHYKGSL